jgi:coenzyme Q-binding protein COQ10
VTSHSETRIVPYTADLMYAAVADVERYPEFLPWVVALRVKSREHVKEREVLLAEMAVGYGALRERYTSRVVLDPSGYSIDVVQTEGPFRVLENHWRFEPAESGCTVNFSIAFEFRSRILNAVATSAFERVMFKMADAFEARAKVLSDHPVQER